MQDGQDATTARGARSAVLAGTLTGVASLSVDAARACLPGAFAYRITSDDTHMVTLCTPAGMEGFFRSAGHDLATPKPAGWEVSHETLRAAADAHGMTLLGPPRTD